MKNARLVVICEASGRFFKVILGNCLGPGREVEALQMVSESTRNCELHQVMESPCVVIYPVKRTHKLVG